MHHLDKQLQEHPLKTQGSLPFSSIKRLHKQQLKSRQTNTAVSSSLCASPKHLLQQII